MKISDQLMHNLKGLGFEEVKPLLFQLTISPNTLLYRDYRQKTPVGYAYFKERKINPYQFPQAKAIEKIERKLEELAENKLFAFI